MPNLYPIENVIQQIRGVTYGQSDVSKEPLDGYLPVLRSNNIKNSQIDLSDLVYVIKSKIKDKQLLKSGDILITASTGSIKVIGKNAQCKSDLNASFGAFCKVIRPKNTVNADYLKHMFQSNRYFSYIQSVVNGANINNIKNEHIDNFKIPLPPLETQKRIAQILDDAQALKQKTEQILKEYDALAQSIFLDMFGDPVTNPKGWEVKKLDVITNLVTDGKHGNCNDAKGSGYYFISAKDINYNQINYHNTREIPQTEFEEVDRRTNLQAGDLVMINTGATIGRMAIAKDIPETRRTTFQKSVAVIKPKRELLCSQFLQFVFELRLDSFSSKGSGSAIKNLLLSEMKRFKIILPPITVQTQFTEKIALIEQQKALAKQELKESEDLFNCLLQKAFKGELI